jgi:NAD(P)H-hydrate epimerase
LIFAGSRGHTGGALLAAHAACRGGAGLTTLAGPASLNDVFSLGIPEVMTAAMKDEDGFIRFDAQAVASLVEGKRAIVIGPGLGTHAGAEALVTDLLKVDRPLVIDADGLTCLSTNLDGLASARAAVVLTPHPGEMARLLGGDVATVQANRVETARAFAQEHRCVVVLKGACSIIAASDGAVWINPTGNAGMACGGMGDVLAGLIGALLAQGLAPADAACLGTYLHGAAADDVARAQGLLGMRATDVAEALPRAFTLLTRGVYPPTFALPRRGE